LSFFIRRLGEALPGGSSSKGMTSEQLELERIKKMQRELQQKRQLSKQSYKMAMANPTKPLSVHTAKDPTVPQVGAVRLLFYYLSTFIALIFVGQSQNHFTHLK
jgi:hypothetical protein